MSEEKTSRFRRLLDSRRGKLLAFSFAVLMAFSLGMASTATARDNLPFFLGKENVAKAISTLKKQGPGPALSLIVGKGQAPLKVNSSARVANLNADKVDGLDAKDLKGKTGPRGPKGEQGEQGATGPQGEQGPQGEAGTPGEDGTNGTDGNTILSGTGAPSDAQGNNGDYYIDNQANELYGPKANGAWGGPVSLEGPRGIQGEAGPQGETGDTGPQGPEGPEGAVGPEGPKGEPGEDGTDGTDGTDGNSVLSGEGEPADDLGSVGDFYIDTESDEIYGPKTQGGWGESTSLVGPQGPQGVQGPQGEDGEQGEEGPQGPEGPQGETGPAGPQGETGPVGPAAEGTSQNTPNTIVQRDGSGNFSAGTITGNLNGNVNGTATSAGVAANANNAQNAQALQGQGPSAFLQSSQFSNSDRQRGQGGINGGGSDYCYVGQVILFAGNYPPPGTAFADGQLLPIQNYQALYAVIGTQYGGNGTTNFALPDLYNLGPDGTSYAICVYGLFPSRP